MDSEDLTDIPRLPFKENDPEVPPVTDTKLLEEREKRESEKCKLARKKEKTALKVVRI